MRYTRFLLVLLYTFCFYSLFSQDRKIVPSPTIQWEKHLGGFQNDEGRMTIETSDGGVLMVGTTHSYAFRGSDVYIAKLSADGEILMQNHFGGSKNEEAFSVVQTFDGGYAIAGYTKSDWDKPSKGEKDAWLIKLNSAGEIEWDKIISTKTDDAFTHIMQQQDGTLLVLGYEGSDMLLMKYNENGEEIARHEFHKTTGIPAAITQNKQGDLIIVGNNVDKGIFLRKINTSGVEDTAFRKVFMDLPLRVVNAVTFTKQSKYVLAGKSIARNSRQDMCIVQLDSLGNIQWLRSYGGAGNDEVKSITQTFTNHYLLTGFTYSHKNGARRSDLWLNYTDTLGREVWKKRYYIGGRQSDEGNHVLQLHNGNFVVTGFSASANLIKDAWMVYLKNEEKFLTNSGRNVVAKDFLLYEPEKNDTLNAEERGYFTLNITNNNLRDIYGLKLKLPITPIVAGLSHPKEIIVGHIETGATKKISIPLATTEALLTRKLNFPIQLCLYEGDTIVTYQIPLQTKALPHPMLQIIHHRFFTDGDSVPVERVKPIGLEITLKNTGEGIAKAANVRFALPYKVDVLSALAENVGDILPGDSVKVRFDFKIKSYYEFDSLEVRCSAFERKYHKSTSEYVGIKVTDFYDVKETPKMLYGIPKKSPKYNRGGMRNFDLSHATENKIIFTWKAPDESEELLDISGHPLNYIDIKIQIISNEEIDSTNAILFLDGKLAQKNIDYEDEHCKTVPFKHNNGKDYKYTYINRVLLHEGINNIQLKIKTPTMEASCDMVKVEVIVVPSKLFLYSIGVPDSQSTKDLRLTYTTKDAIDFANIFSSQKKQLFDSIIIDTITSVAKTKAISLGDTFNMLNDLQNDGTIKAKDKVMFFISSHGFLNSEKDLIITASDFNAKNKEFTSISLKKHLLEKLQRLPCTSFVFVDACQEDENKAITPNIANKERKPNTTDNKNNALLDKNEKLPRPVSLTQAKVSLSNSPRNSYIITSSQNNEKSFEDNTWQNGAFTYIIKEAFATKQTKTNTKENFLNADLNKDRIVTLEELFTYIEKRVPEIVKSKKSEVQRPSFIQEVKDDPDKPIIVPLYRQKE